MSISLSLSLSCPGLTATARPLSVRPSYRRTAGLLHSPQNPQQAEHHLHVPTLLLGQQRTWPAAGCSPVAAVHTNAADRRRQCAERSQTQNVLLQLFQQRVCGVCVCPGAQGLHVFGVCACARAPAQRRAPCCAVLSQVSRHLGICRVCRREQLLYLACMRVCVCVCRLGCGLSV